MSDHPQLLLLNLTIAPGCHINNVIIRLALGDIDTAIKTRDCEARYDWTNDSPIWQDKLIVSHPG